MVIEPQITNLQAGLQLSGLQLSGLQLSGLQLSDLQMVYPLSNSSAFDEFVAACQEYADKLDEYDAVEGKIYDIYTHLIASWMMRTNIKKKNLWKLESKQYSMYWNTPEPEFIFEEKRFLQMLCNNYHNPLADYRKLRGKPIASLFKIDPLTEEETKKYIQDHFYSRQPGYFDYRYDSKHSNYAMWYPTEDLGRLIMGDQYTSYSLSPQTLERSAAIRSRLSENALSKIRYHGEFKNQLGLYSKDLSRLDNKLSDAGIKAQIRWREGSDIFDGIRDAKWKHPTPDIRSFVLKTIKMLRR
jgi:hypothetical protein